MTVPAIAAALPASTALAEVPPPPPGPGVQPPFVAPPTDGATSRRWWAIGLAGASALLVCVGGLFGVGAVLVFSVQTTIDQSRAAVTTYLEAIRQEQYPQAYALLCEEQQDRVDEDVFVRTVAAAPVASFTVGEPDFADQIVVPATLHYRAGGTDQRRFVVEPDAETGEFEVCGEAN